jgi:hypothetical protein
MRIEYVKCIDCSGDGYLDSRDRICLQCNGTGTIAIAKKNVNIASLSSDVLYSSLLKRVERLEKMNETRPDQKEFESRLKAVENGLRSIQRWIPLIREFI